MTGYFFHDTGDNLVAFLQLPVKFASRENKHGGCRS